jgi:putative endonuclease
VREGDPVTISLYILRCVDGSYYVGTTRAPMEKRLAEHQAGTFGGYTAGKWPVELMFQQDFERIEDAISAERQIKGWRREKKEALIRGNFLALPRLAQRGSKRPICTIQNAQAAIKGSRSEL